MHDRGGGARGNDGLDEQLAELLHESRTSDDRILVPVVPPGRFVARKVFKDNRSTFGLMRLHARPHPSSELRNRYSS